MLLDLPPDQQALIDRVAALARERFAPRAAAHDQAASFPGDDLADLFAAGLNAPTLPRERGGLGLGPLRGDTYVLWMITKQLAKADLSLARCFEGHANSLLLLDALASAEQQDRWFPGVVERGRSGWCGAASRRCGCRGRRRATAPP